MKKKLFDKKLVLNKSTVADLDGGQMSKVQGGDPVTANCTTQVGHLCENTCQRTTGPICWYTCTC